MFDIFFTPSRALLGSGLGAIGGWERLRGGGVKLLMGEDERGYDGGGGRGLQ